MVAVTIAMILICFDNSLVTAPAVLSHQEAAAGILPLGERGANNRGLLFK